MKQINFFYLYNINQKVHNTAPNVQKKDSATKATILFFIEFNVSFNSSNVQQAVILSIAHHLLQKEHQS